MERETGNSVSEKNRLRAMIDSQIRRYLECGGHITVIEDNRSSPGKLAQVGGLAAEQDVLLEVD